MNKTKLDEIIAIHKAQPVGHGYIDIIVCRDSFKKFISDLVNNGFIIGSISWWEWCPGDENNKYGLGGPRSNFYEGWFSELPIELDKLKLSESLDNESRIEEIMNMVESKQISYPGETVTFKFNKWLTPAFWLEVPDAWRNSYNWEKLE